jgi:hypothetical protein
MRIEYIGDLAAAATVNLQDTASQGNNYGLRFYTAGNAVILGDTFVSTNDWISIGASGNLTYSGGTISTGATHGYDLISGGTLTLGTNLPTAYEIGLVGGMSRAMLNYLDNNDVKITTATQLADLIRPITGAINASGVTVNGTHQVVMAANNINLNASTVQSSAGNVYAAVGQDFRLSNGSLLYGFDDVYIALAGSSSVLYINELAGQTASKIHAGSPTTINIGFLSRSSGGVVIDGLETVTTVAGSSGFYVGASPVPATPGNGLQIAYASVTADLCAISPDLCNPKPPADTPIDEPPPTFEITGPGGTQPGSGGGSTAGGTEGSFGGEEGNGDKKDEKKDDKDKKSDQAKDEKKDDKPGQKKVAQCS